MEVYTILFNRLLSEAAKRQAAELHLSVGSIPVIRQGGAWQQLAGEKIIEQELLGQIVNSFLSENEQKELTKNKEITVVKELGGGFRFKINVYYQKNLLAASFRFIPEAIRDFTNLQLPPIVKTFAEKTGGLFMVAGAYSSGKTNTIAAIIEHLNQSSKKRILTLENLIEILFVSKQSIIEQRQIGHDVPTLVDGLKYAQRQDIDVLVVSDIQSGMEEAIPLLLEIASGTCFVILEINANSTIQAIENVLKYYATPKLESGRLLLADVLQGVMAQKLLPKNGGGLVLASEILVATAPVKAVIREGKIKQLSTIIQNSGQDNMVSMNKSLIGLVEGGQITREIAMAEATNKEDFNIMIK